MGESLYIDRRSDRPIIEKDPIHRGSYRPIIGKGPIDRLLKFLRFLIIGLSDPRSIGPSVYRTLGLSDPRSNGPSVADPRSKGSSVYRALTVDINNPFIFILSP